MKREEKRRKTLLCITPKQIATKILNMPGKCVCMRQVRMSYAWNRRPTNTMVTEAFNHLQQQFLGKYHPTMGFVKTANPDANSLNIYGIKIVQYLTKYNMAHNERTCYGISQRQVDKLNEWAQSSD